MKKLVVFLLSVCLLGILSIRPASAAENSRIPFPAGYDTTSEGASSLGNKADHLDTPYFAQIDFFQRKSGGSLVILEKFRTYQQTREWSCGNAAGLMVLWHFGDTKYDELTLAKRMNTTALPADGKIKKGVLYGTDAKGIANFFREIGYEVSSSLDAALPDGLTFDDPVKFKSWVLTNLKRNIPVMVDWLDWSGHWQVIIGYDDMGTEMLADDVLILADPYDVGDHLQDGYYIYPAERFYYMWQDPQHQPEGHKAQQWVIARPKTKA
jgi:hypothetical protein